MSGRFVRDEARKLDEFSRGWASYGIDFEAVRNHPLDQYGNSSVTGRRELT